MGEFEAATKRQEKQEYDACHCPGNRIRLDRSAGPDSGKKRKIVIIFDELDKTDSAKRPEHSEGLPEFEKLSVRPEQKVSSRTRKQEVLRIIANMKFFFSTAKAYFIFIAGREMYEAYQADMSDRDFSISSIFSGVINVDSFLTSSRNTNNSNQMTEQFICKQLMPPHIEDLIAHAATRKYDRKNIYCLKNYYHYRITAGQRYNENEWKADGTPDEVLYRQRIWKEILFLYHFISYLTYVSNGSPKKMTLFFEKNIRKGGYLEKESKMGRLYQWKHEQRTPYAIKETDTFLSFGYYTQEKVNFIHHLTYPIMQTIMNRSNLYGDKLLVSSSFLISHIFKLHNNGFSWRNLEQTPELLEINKTPEIREYIGSIIDFMNHTHLTTIACGLFHYKFPMRIAEEISYHSKISGEVSALFNFSLDEMQTIKNHYMRLLKYNEHEQGVKQYSQASIHHSLGDIYMQEENYSDAIREYEKSMEYVMPVIEAQEGGIQQLNYISFLNRTMLKLGLAHEKRRTDNSAFIVYEELILLLKRFAPTYRTLFDNMRTLHLALVARLYTLEKIDTTGICYAHLAEVCGDFYEMFNSCSNFLVAADFYRKLGDVLFYKNQTYGSFFQRYSYSAEIFYHKSLSLILKANCSPLHRVDGRCVYFCNKALNIKSRLGASGNVNKQRKPSRDNYIYHMALALENLGHVELSGYQRPYHFHRDFLGKFADAVKASEQEITFRPRNNMERAMLYYWTASRLYNISCERSLSAKCYREIAYTLLAYLQNLEPGSLTGNSDHEIIFRFIQNLCEHFLISQYRQYEHINLSEMDVLQWMKGLEMFQNIDCAHLSISPDVEELIYVYYTLKLYLYGTVHEGKLATELRRFYRSELLTGRHPCSTLSSTVLNLRLKAKYNEQMLATLFGCSCSELEDVLFKQITDYIDNGCEDALMNEIFPEALREANENSRLNVRLDLLEYLITDGLFCLSRMLELIIPLRNTTLFNHSFKASVYLRLLRFVYLYKLLYCYYSYGNGNQAGDAQIETYLKSRGVVFPISTYKHFGNYDHRRQHFFENVMKAMHKSSPAHAQLSFLAENAIHYYTKARQMHFQGKAYQETIRNLFFLDDDLNNDTLQFYIALERFYIASEVLHHTENELKERYSTNSVYQIDRYFNELI